MEWYDKLILALVSLNLLGGLALKFIWSPEEKRAIQERLKLAEAKSVSSYTEDMEAMQGHIGTLKEKVEKAAKKMEKAIEERDKAHEIINELRKPVQEIQGPMDTPPHIQMERELEQLSSLTGPAFSQEFRDSFKNMNKEFQTVGQAISEALSDVDAKFQFTKLGKVAEILEKHKGVKITSFEEVRKGMIPDKKID
jgi:chromosome segregation ATPase